jgi:carboxymethylenebutenolidase
MSHETSALSPAQQRLSDVWEEHMKGEFATKSVEETMAIAAFYRDYFIPQMPPDTETVPVSRTIGDTQIVDEMIFKFTHSIRMDWMLPGIEPTGKRVEVPLVAIIGFKDGKVMSEHIYWDQASVLVQLGLLEADKLPVVGIEATRKILDPTLPSNTLIEGAAAARR